MPRLLLLSLCLAITLPTTAPAGLVISQYYEGAGTNNWIELFNSSASAVNLEGYSIGVWKNGNAEGYKSGVAPTASVTLPNFSLPSGGIFLLGRNKDGAPLIAPPDYVNAIVVEFDGNDSFAIYAAGAYSTSALVDAIGFTAENEGKDKSFVRLTLDAGYDLVTGSNATMFPAVWGSMTHIVANGAQPGTDAYLGFTSLTTALAPVPEPTAALAGGLLAGALGLSVARRPSRRG